MGKIIQGVWGFGKNVVKTGCCPHCGCDGFEQISYIEGVATPVSFGDGGQPHYGSDCRRRVADGIVGGYRCLTCATAFTVVGDRTFLIDNIASVRDLAQLLGILSGAAAEVLAQMNKDGERCGALSRLKDAVQAAASYGLVEIPR